MRINVMRHKNVQKSDMSRAQMDETYKTIVAPAPKAPTPKAATPKAPTPKAATPKASSAPAPVVKALSAASMSRQMPLYAMSGTELRELATSMSLPVQLDHDRATIIKMIQQSTTTGKGGKKR
jgi:3-oxoacyl-ACP reductase-like protein